MNWPELSLAVVGACVLFAYPTHGPTAWVREGLRKVIRRVCLYVTQKPKDRYGLETILDCLRCEVWWTGLAVGLYNDCWWVSLTSVAFAWMGLQFTGGKISSR